MPALSKQRPATSHFGSLVRGTKLEQPAWPQKYISRQLISQMLLQTSIATLYHTAYRQVCTPVGVGKPTASVSCSLGPRVHAEHLAEKCTMHTANAVLAALALLCARARSLSTLVSAALCKRYLGARVSGRGAAATRVEDAAAAPRAACTPVPAPAGPAAARVGAGPGFDALQEKAWNAASEGAAPYAGVRPVRAAGLLVLRAARNITCRALCVTGAAAGAADGRDGERRRRAPHGEDPGAGRRAVGAHRAARRAAGRARRDLRRGGRGEARQRARRAHPGPSDLQCPQGAPHTPRGRARRWVSPLPGPAGRGVRAAQVLYVCFPVLHTHTATPAAGQCGGASPALQRDGSAPLPGQGRQHGGQPQVPRPPHMAPALA